jgi:2-polyprenyl-3-methyl-5-hydroxy-6-metoxy-1,4-benzoquinol methylase
MASQNYPCLHCGQLLDVVAAFASLPRVTSDSKPFRAGGDIGCCAACGLVQKPLTSKLKADLDEVYSNYSMFSQSSGLAEQGVFDAAGKVEISRSALVIRHAIENVLLPSQGVFLDVGAGTGCLLAAFADQFPQWQLHAQDLDDRYKPRFSSMPHFEKFHAGDIENLEGSFDVIGLSHSLEHFEDPAGMLRALAAHLNPGGIILIQVPDLAGNIFDLVVCDHLSHFTEASLAAVAESAGFARPNVRVWRGVVEKQLTMVVSPQKIWMEEERPSSAVYDLEEGVYTLIQHQEDYQNFLRSYDRVALFGVATGTTWFAGIDSSKVVCFVDEDESRIGSTHLGIQVIAPAQLPKEIPVFLGGVLGSVKGNVATRLAALGLITETSPEPERVIA